jgi:uncharacterized protein (TIGR02231 family)
MKKRMKYLGILFVCLFCIDVFGQGTKQVESTLTHATVFLSNAQLTRVVKAKVEAGKQTLLISGLSAQLDPSSIQVGGKGTFTILGIQHQHNYLTESNVPASLKLLRDSLHYYQQQVTIEKSQLEILNKEEQLILNNQKIGGTQQNITVAELKAMADFYRTRLGEIVQTRVKLEDKLKRLNTSVSKVQQQINDQQQNFSKNTSEILINIDAQASTTVELSVKYLVRSAGWSPVYDLRAVDSQSPIQLSYKANVYQQTGEDWKNIKLTLSSVNASAGGIKPDLYPQYVTFYQPITNALQGRMAGVQVSKKNKEVQGYLEAEVDEVVNYAPAAMSVSDDVFVAQTSISTEFEIGIPYSVPSTSKPTLVDIQQHTLQASYAYAVAPKLDKQAFLMAYIKGWETFDILPGEANVFFEGTYVTKTYLDPTNIKDSLAISLGRDPRIVVTREKIKDYTAKKTIGTNIRETIGWEISIRNTKREAIRIVVEDQIPVSQNSQIEITNLELSQGQFQKETGKVTWDFRVAPSETKKQNLKYELKYPKDKSIVGL